MASIIIMSSEMDLIDQIMATIIYYSLPAWFVSYIIYAIIKNYIKKKR